MKKNDIITAEIEAISYGGSGICKADGIVVFVPRTVKGDLCEIRILKVFKSYAFGKIERLIAPSSEREEHFCLFGGKCGCCFADFSYETELKYKKRFIEDAFSRIGKTEFEISNVIPSPKTVGYRNKAMFPVSKKNGELKIGFYRQHSHSIVDIERCMLHDSAFDAVIPVFKDWILKNNVSVYDELTGKGLIRHVGGRVGVKTNEVMIIIVANGEKLPNVSSLIEELKAKINGLKSVILNVNNKTGNEIMGEKCITLWGDDFITDLIGDLSFSVSPLSFFQINPYQVEKLYTTALELMQPQKNDILLDIFCGTGTITQFFARKVSKAVGIEIVKEAVIDAEKNAERNSLSNCTFICEDAGIAAKELKESGFKPDIVTLDPARKGLDELAVKTVCEFSPKKIVYIACDPTTQARDVKKFVENGYEIKKIQPVDMFPRTYHIENVVLLTKI